jgi:anti-anti-sigma factor
MQVLQKEKDGILVCSVNGEINIDTVYQIKDAFKKILDSDKDRVVLNFEKVSYIDSLGMSNLAGFAKQLSAKGGELVLCSLSPKLGSIFHIVKLGKVFRIFDTEDEALKNI